MSNRRSFTPQVQDSDGQSDSDHFDEESRDNLPSTSHENQSEGDSESTRSLVNIMSVAMFVVYDIWRFFSYRLK